MDNLLTILCIKQKYKDIQLKRDLKYYPPIINSFIWIISLFPI